MHKLQENIHVNISCMSQIYSLINISRTSQVQSLIEKALFLISHVYKNFLSNTKCFVCKYVNSSTSFKAVSFRYRIIFY